MARRPPPLKMETKDEELEEGDTEVPAANSGILNVSNIAPGGQVEVTRVSPQPAAGYLGNLTITEEGNLDILQEIRDAWGGGTYQLRIKEIVKNGRLAYGGQSARVVVAGAPRAEGREYVNGQWRSIAVESAGAPASAPTPVSPSAAAKDSTIEILQTILPMLAEKNLGTMDLPGVISAISSMTGPGAAQSAPAAQASNPMGDMEKMLGFIVALQNSPLVSPPPPPEPASDPMSMESLLPMMMMRMMQPQQPQPPPGWYGMPPAHSAARPPAAPPAPAPAPAPAYAAAPDPAPAPAPEAATGPAPVEDYEPLTADEIIEDISARPENERNALMMELITKLGLDENMAKAMFGDQNSPAGFSLDLPKGGVA